MTFSEILSVTNILIQYLVPTLKVFFFTLLCSIPLGMVVAMLKMSRFRPVSWITNIYILIMRGTPLMLQVIVAYFAIPMLKKSSFLPGAVQGMLNNVDIRGDSYMFAAILFAFSHPLGTGNSFASKSVTAG